MNYLFIKILKKYQKLDLKLNNMGKHKDEGDAALTLAEECAEVIQVITKKYRFYDDWNNVPPGKSQTRLEELKAEMADVIYAWERFLKEIE